MCTHNCSSGCISSCNKLPKGLMNIIYSGDESKVSDLCMWKMNDNANRMAIRKERYEQEYNYKVLTWYCSLDERTDKLYDKPMKTWVAEDYLELKRIRREFDCYMNMVNNHKAIEMGIRGVF